jgi:hypothetical protein
VNGIRTRVALAVACLVWLPGMSGSVLAQQQQPATFRVVVKDPSGAVIPKALVQITGTEARTQDVTIVALVTDAVGAAVAQNLIPGRYSVQAAFPGFETRVLPDVRVRAGENHRDIVLPLQKLDESVSVARDPATVASDPRSDRFSTVLSKDQIDALPDDPDEMEQMLKDMAGPGATIRVDGFRGGKLPPKSQIRSIRFSTGQFAAENHSGGFTFVDISTQPGIGPLRGGVDIAFRAGALNARNAFESTKGPEQTQQYAFNMSGTLRKERTSFSLSAGGTSLYDSANIFAALPDGSYDAAIKRPTDKINFSGRIDHALTRAHALRATLQQNSNDQRTLGVGGFDLADRAYSRTSTDTLFRMSESGPWARNWFAESRVQLHWTSNDTRSDVEAPTVRVLDAFTSGGAQQSGGRASTELDWATTIDWAHGRHAVRMGTELEGGSYRSDSATNYLGAYTFPSLTDFEAGRPATYMRRTGDPLVEYTLWQAGVFVQDDWRARKNLTLSGGLRQELQTHLGDTLNLAPRAGLTWAPFTNGKTTVRAGGGIFYDWLDADTYEQTLRVDGVKQEDLVIRNPAYPGPPGTGSDAQRDPPGKYILAANLVMPERLLTNVGVSHQVSSSFTFNVNVTHSRGSWRLRGRNINPPGPDGARTDPSFGNITQVESTGRSRGTSLGFGGNYMAPSRRLFVFANCAWLHQENDADGPFSLPADNHNPGAEWGPASGVPHYLASAIVNLSVTKSVRVGVSAAARSGTPYTITTGSDANGDTVFNDRPAGVGRNSAWTAASWDMAARASYTFGFGQRVASAGGPGGTPVVIVRRVGGDSAGDLLNGMPGGSAGNKRIGFELYVSAQNLLNHVNPIGYSGVMTSPFFGQPTAAAPARKLDLGVKILF